MLSANRPLAGSTQILSRAGLAVGGVAAIVLAVSLAIIAVPLAKYTPATDASGGSADKTAVAVSTTTDMSTSASVRLSWTSGHTVVAHELTGDLATRIFVTPGHTLECGKAALEIDDRTVESFCGSRPLWRPVGPETTGPDAQEAIDFLRSQGLLRAGKPSGGEVAAAIDEWQRRTHASVTGEITPGAVVWIPAPIVIAKVMVQVGDAIHPDLALFASAATVTRAVVVPSPRDGSRWLFNVEGDASTFVVGRSGSISTTSGLAQALSRALTGSREVEPTTAQGVLRRATAVHALALPPSAVRPTATNDCVVEIDRTGHERPLVVTVLDATDDRVIVRSSLRPGTVVRLDPDVTGCG